ncbi:centromere protein U isoform X1 [Podarcis lilfordi]|uniref:Centromere protein U isoform X1 n=1 Tax=Podarcis lilfordi TaxID=74358 RepID=A0AA35KHA0_9SAUR|nr:centromere protein U isoform X1 [Podarcis lilfordi]
MGHLPSSELNDYESFKKLVMQRHGLHPENYRKAFRKVEKSGLSDNIAVFSAKMAQNFELWLAAEGVGDFEGFKQLILIEQLMRSLPSEIASLVADQKPRTLTEATTFAESFRLNRSHWTNKGPSNVCKPAVSMGKSAPPIKEQSKGFLTSAKDSVVVGGERTKLSPTSGLCFFCKQPGHVKAACPQLGSQKPPILTSTPAVHLIQRQEEDWEGEQQKAGAGETPILDGKGVAAPDVMAPGTAEATSNAVIVGPVGTSADPNAPHVKWAISKFTAPIEVNGIAVNSFRDTGSDITSVSRDLVMPIQMQDKPMKISPYGVKEIFQPTAIIPISYMGFQGKMLVIVHDPKMCKSPVLVGNDLGYRVHQQQHTVNICSIKVSPTQVQGMENWGTTPQGLRAEENLVPDGEGGSLAPDAITPETTGTVETAVSEKLVGRRVGLIRTATPCVNWPCSASDVIPRVHRVVVPSFQSMDSVTGTLPKDSVLSQWNQPDFQKSNSGGEI